jgi:hypothetical protein
MPGSWERTGTDDAPVWVLDFPHRPGLEVRCTVPSLRARVLAARVAPLLASGGDRDGRALLALAEVFGEDCLLGWNLTWNGRSREASGAGMGRLDVTLVGEILSTWVGLWLEQPAEPEAEPELDWSELADMSVDLPDDEVPVEAGLVAVAGG